jgi:hypothetical protein
MTFWQQFLQTIARNPISMFAVLCVSCTAAFLGYMSDRMLTVLESSNWCAKAIQAERITPGNSYVGLTTCVDLLKIQLQAVAKGFHTGLYAYAASLVVLIVVVVAGARAAGKLPGGIEFDVSKDDAPAAAQAVAAAATDKADEITEEAKP